jgi:hypothetical protein
MTCPRQGDQDSSRATAKLQDRPWLLSSQIKPKRQVFINKAMMRVIQVIEHSLENYKFNPEN